MFSALKVRRSQGTQYIVDLRAAKPAGFRGRPVAGGPCDACDGCRDACPTKAISLLPLRVDLGRCLACAECVDACPSGVLAMSSEVRLGASAREALVVPMIDAEPLAIAVSAALAKMFGRSLKLRSVSAGGCNACELELNAMANVNFDFGRYGIDWVASPRHADGLVLSGPLTRNMAEAIALAYEGMPEPKFVIAFGACAISGGPYADSAELDRSFLERFTPSLYVPGCPPHPLTFVHALLDLLGIDVTGS
jgi:Ni,Fe-hydrogenase III small subunit